MAKLKAFLTSWWTISVIVALLLVLLFCVGLPLVTEWFRPTWLRVTLLLAIIAGWGLLAVLRVLKARRAERELAEGLGGGGEGAIQAQRIREALAKLRSAGGGKRRGYLYSRPWYVIIGPPLSGKTTALINSGLRFPFTDQRLEGTGGTRNLDFLFADEAVLIDTAGRYTSQDSDASADAKAWSSFLGLLRRYRPLQPVNGVIVAIGADDLLRGDLHALDRHAATIRRRLGEIRTGLEIEVPVYLMVTKFDLLPGFIEFFEDLDVEGRRAVLGHTFRHGDGRPGSDRMVAAFDTVAQAVADRQARRLADELDGLRRSLILGFPAQLTLLRARLVRLMEGAFPAGDGSGQLRGFYFTSGVQEGTPIDRLLDGVAQVYDRLREGSLAAGKAYFLNRVLAEVLFPESGLVQLDPVARRRLRSRVLLASGAIATAAVVVLGLWGISFVRNLGLQDTLQVQARTVADTARQHGIDLRQVSASDGDLEQALPVLDQLRALAQGYADTRAGGPPLLMTFGLFQSGHAAKAQEAYREGLRRILLPRLMLRAETAIRQNMASPLQVYEPLKIYLMLGGERPKGIDAAAVRGWVQADWAQAAYPGTDRADLRKRLAVHLDALLEDKDMASVWPGRKPPLDGQLVAQGRATVASGMSVADRAYAILRQQAGTQAGAPWAATTVISSGDAAAFANGPEVLQLQVPYFFTRAGYEKIYQPGLLTVQRALEDDLWVLGADADTASIRAQIASVQPGVAGAYAAEYIAQWEGVIKAMHPAAYFRDLAALGAFTKTPSPWKLLLLEVRKNTTFAGGTGAAAGLVAQKVTQRLGSLAQVVPAGGGPLDAGAQIAAAFKDLNAYVGDEKGTGPIDDFIKAVKEAGTSISAAQTPGIGTAGAAMAPQMATSTATVGVVGAQAPAQLRGFVTETASGGATAGSDAQKGAISSLYSTQVLPACKGVVDDHYPFVLTATADVAMTDALRVFGAGGVMDGFVRDQVMPMVDTAGPVWRWRADSPISSTLNPSSAEAFALAPQIRDLLAGGMPFTVAVETLGAGIDSAEFGMGGVSYRFAAGASGPKALQWNPLSAAPEAHVTLSKGGQVVDTIEANGPWALFRLIDKASKRNAGPAMFVATYGSGDRTAAFRITLTTDHNPFNRGGLWSFRCPAAL